MAILYLEFDTNLQSVDEGEVSPSVDYITLSSNATDYSLSCNFESEFSLSGGHYSARWKGVDIIGGNSDTDDDEVDRELTEEDLRLLEETTEISDIGLYIYGRCLECENPIVTNLSVRIEVGEGSYSREQQSISPTIYGG